MAESGTPGLPLFPIQLLKVDIGEIAYSCAGFSDATKRPTDKFDLNVAVSPYDETTKALQVALSFNSKFDPAESSFPHAYSLRITVHGQFQVVAEEKLPFPVSEMRKWAEKNGTIILLPFLRESVYTITQKTGFQPLMIPMIEVAAFRVGAPNHAQAMPASASRAPIAIATKE